MNYKQLLIDSQKSGVSAMLEFVLQYRDFDKVVACFVEGKDSSYYRSRVENNVDMNNEVLFYSCNGKSEVELVKRMIDYNLHLKKDVKTLYFCDNDYGIDDKVNGVFYTDFYSIENYYSTESFIKKIIKNVFNINIYNPEYNICMDLYKEKYKKFNEQIIKLNAYCYGLRVKEKELSSLRSNFNCIKLRDILINDDFEDFELRKFDYDIIKSMIVSENPPTKQEYDECLKIIDKTKLRGKWELLFVIWFLDGLRKQIKNGGSGLSKNNRNIISFQNEIMTSMGKYAITTESLINYITQNVM